VAVKSLDSRLPTWCRATHYDLELAVDVQAGRYVGNLDLDLDLRRASSRLVMHCAGPSISEVTGVQDGTVAVGAVVTDPTSETIDVVFPTEMRRGKLTLRISFGAEMRGGMRGFYRSESGGLPYAATQFEPAEARTAFPCLDEPDQKATFRLTLVAHEGYVALSNAPRTSVHRTHDGRQVVRFARTRPLPPFLMAWAVGPFIPTEPALTSSGAKVCVWLPRSFSPSDGAIALAAHIAAIDWLEAYLRENCPVSKLDAVGVPQLGAGAMENPGMFTYRLVAIACDPARPALLAEQTIFATAAHECAHLWFGDLVTIRWWDDLWLAEAMATFLATKLTADLHPEWHPWAQFVSRLEPAFALDELPSAHPVATEVTDVAATRYQFDAITYAKGAAVLRMLERWAGPERFREGLQRYVARHRDGTAGREELWAALGESAGIPEIVNVARSWCSRTGYPVTAVTRAAGRADQVVVRTAKWVAPGNNASALPLTVAYARQGARQEMTVLTSDEGNMLSLGETDWILPNPATVSFSRTAEPSRWARGVIAAHAHLHLEERLGLAWDLWASVRRGRSSVVEMCELLPPLIEPHPIALNAVLSISRWLHNNVPQSRPVVHGMLGRVFHPIARSGTNSSLGTREAAGAFALALEALGQLVGDEEAIRCCEEGARRWLSGETLENIETTAANLTTAATRGDDRFLAACIERLSATRDPQQRTILLRTLAGFRGDALVACVLERCISAIPPEDQPLLIDLLLRESAARDRTAQFLIHNWARLQRLDPIALDRITMSLANVVLGEMAPATRAFLEGRSAADPAARRALDRLALEREAAERIRFVLATGQVLAEDEQPNAMAASSRASLFRPAPMPEGLIGGAHQ
jgi:aminopeptidase N